MAKNLASRGAQLILLTRHAPSDVFLSEYVDDLRATTQNELIYSEQVDLSSLRSIRRFATKWIDNAPPRRLDMIILCADVTTPYWGTGKITQDGVEEEWMVNYLSMFHLLSILSPAIRAQPPDRDVRVLFSTCNSYVRGESDLASTEQPTRSGRNSSARSRRALLNFAASFQKHLESYRRPDKHSVNAHTVVIDPGFTRTPGMRRFLTGGSLLGLVAYLLTWPLWWLVLKSPDNGAQSYLQAAMADDILKVSGVKFLKECRVTNVRRQENEAAEQTLWHFSEAQIERLEKNR